MLSHNCFLNDTWLLCESCFLLLSTFDDCFIDFFLADLNFLLTTLWSLKSYYLLAAVASDTFRFLGSCCGMFICCSHYVVSWPYSSIWAYLSSSQDFRTLRDRWPIIIFSPRCRKLALFQMVLIIAGAILKLAKDAPVCNLGQTMPW